MDMEGTSISTQQGSFEKVGWPGLTLFELN